MNIELAKTRLMQLMLQQRLPQVLLLQGAFQATKTIAQYLTEIFFCTALKVDHVACNQCRACTLRLAHSHPDFLDIASEIPEASIKIDQVRALQYFANTTPSMHQAKLLCLQNAARLTESACNAMLKTLEEPASFIYWVLTVEKVSQVPATLLSRCVRLPIHMNVITPIPEIQQQLLEDLYSLLVLKQENALSMAENWLNFSVEGVIDGLWYLVCKFIQWEYRQDTQAMDKLEFAKWQALTQACSRKLLWKLQRKLQDARELLHTSQSINQQLLIQNIALSLGE